MQPAQSRPSDAVTRLLSSPGIAMETPSASPRALLLSTASGPGRKRAAAEAGAVARKQKVLDEEEYIEVRPRCGRQRFLGPPLPPPPSSRSSGLPPHWLRHSPPLAEVKQPESLPPLGFGQYESQINTVQKGLGVLDGGSSVVGGRGGSSACMCGGLGKQGFLLKPE